MVRGVNSDPLRLLSCRAAKLLVQLVRRLALHRLGDVPIDSQGNTAVAMAEPLLDHLRVDSHREQDRRGGVPQIVKL